MGPIRVRVHSKQLAEHGRGQTQSREPPTLNRRIDSADILARHVATWKVSRDRIQSKADWQITTENVPLKLKLLYPIHQV